MTQRLVFIHTVPLLVDVFNRLAAELLPGIRRLHILDEPLLERVIQRGASAPEDAQRLAEHVSLAAAIGAQAVLVTCSTLSPSVDDLPGAAPIPVFKIDAAMIRQAVSKGGRIGVLATNVSTLRPTQSLLEAEAARAGRSITTTLRLVEDARAALQSGDGARYDQLVKTAALELAPQVDVVVLAQATMARVLQVVSPSDCAVPILSSPRLALNEIGQRVFGGPT
jgi:aspartate/glutamate racemase